ncbi:MAG: ADP-forming succinate--CoA ligase subunit beta [Chloroflexi bacterium]|nr:MAG: ADP-forming succinate--CoA ligase subunit beta [Chloroflexota bacterium]
MKIHEAEARQLLADAGLAVPDASTATTPAGARAAAERLFSGGASQVVIKAQVLVGGRGKAGGVKLAATPEEAEQVAAGILALEIKGLPVRRVLIAPAATILREIYLAALIDRSSRGVLLMASAAGGMEIEEVAAKSPEAIVRVVAHPHAGLLPYQARQLGFGIGLSGELLKQFCVIAAGLVRIARSSDADLVEVNPLAVVPAPELPGGERLVCLDAKVTLDDSALDRHPELAAWRDADSEDPIDREAREQGIAYIRLDGSIGCMVNGAGLAMTTLDLVTQAGGSPANFLDIGGGARSEKVAAAMRIILADPGVKAILVNIFGGITRGDEVAKGLIAARDQQDRVVPMVVRIVGTNAKEAAELLTAGGFETAASLDEAAEKAVALAGAGGAAR